METKLQAEPRSDSGKGPARRLRATGRVPATLYGHGVQPTSISVSAQDLLHLFHQGGGSSVLVDLKLDGDELLTIVREVQRDHIHNRFIHVDFMAVSRDEKIVVRVELHETGEARGQRAGGVVEHHLREVEIRCLPAEVPERIEFDISHLAIGESLRVGDLTPPSSGIEFLTDPDTMVLAVVEPAVMDTELDLGVAGEEAPEPAAAEAEAAPEAAPEGEAPEGEGAPEEGEAAEGEGGSAEGSGEQ